MILRAIKEWWNPWQKCERIGHAPMKTVVHKIRKDSKEYRVVVEDFEAKFDECQRCGKILKGPYDLKLLDWYNSCEMPTEWWRKIRKIGYLILD